MAFSFRTSSVQPSTSGGVGQGRAGVSEGKQGGLEWCGGRPASSLLFQPFVPEGARGVWKKQL